MKILYEDMIEVRKIAVSPRPVWKCRTCPMYGENPSCPPYVPLWEETQKWISRFKNALVVKFSIDKNSFDEDKKSVLKYLLKKEKVFFGEGNPFAFSLFSGNCSLCDRCEFKGSGKCSDPTKVRPSIDAIGIEIGSVAKIDFAENVLYGLVLID